MYNLIRWYNQNRRKFWGIVVATFAIILLVWRLMYITTNRSLNQDAYTSQSQQVDTSNLNSITLTNDKSAITGKKASIDQNGIEIIDKFVSFCNSGSIQEAYNLLSNECKEQLYNELNDFQQAYYTPIFGNGRRNVNIENWNGDIFKVDYNEDALATGRYSVENSIQDYITIVNDEEENKKLNINGYIGRTIYDKNVTEQSLEVKLLRKDAYMDYEIYTFDVKNNSGDITLLGKVDDTENVSYLMDKNEIKYNAYVHEIPQTLLEILGNQEKTIQIKYFNEYSSTSTVNRLVFPKIYLHYESYANFENKNNYLGYANITFEL